MVQKTTLPSGARIVSDTWPHAYSVTLGVWAEVGSRDEGESESGVSHFIEHMAFKGTARRSAQQIAREIDLLGGAANAFTSKEYTCFHAKALANHLPDICDLLCDLLLEPAYDPLELERERQVILQEIGMVEDTPDELAHVLFSQHYFPHHSLGRAVLGTSQTIAVLDRQAIMGYLQRQYAPGRVVVAAVGDLEHQRLVDLMAPALERLTGDARRNHDTMPKPSPSLNVVYRELEQAHLAMGTPAPSSRDPERFSAAVLNTVLGGNMSSRLFQEVRERRGLAYSVFSYLQAFSDVGLLNLYLGVSPANAAAALEVVRTELARLTRQPPSDTELAEAKEHLKGSILLAAENPENQMARQARNEFNFGRAVELSEVIEKLTAVSAQEVLSLAQRSLDPDALGITVLGPLSARELAP